MFAIEFLSCAGVLSHLGKLIQPRLTSGRVQRFTGPHLQAHPRYQSVDDSKRDDFKPTSPRLIQADSSTAV